MVEELLDQDVQVRLTSGRRTRKVQRELWEMWVRGESDLPAAPPGTSKHEFGLAADLVTDDLEAAVRAARAVGLRWGGRRDPVHFEL